MRRKSRSISPENHLKIIVVLLLVLGILWSITLLRGSARNAEHPLLEESITATEENSPAQKQSERAPSPASLLDSATKRLSAGFNAGLSTLRSDKPKTQKPRPQIIQGALELPSVEDTTYLIRNAQGRYTLLYDTTYRQAQWVAYLLTRSDLEQREAERSSSFVRDPEVVSRGWPSATTGNYTHSGYDRGHLLPSADRLTSPEANKATFYLSNVSPQRPALNRKAWKALEEQVREWAVRYDSIYVITGSKLTDALPTIKGGVGIPAHFFKALLTYQAGKCYAIGYVLPNAEQMESSFSEYALTVDELELRLGYNLFAVLPTSDEKAEATLDLSFWR